jgi:hypothetical protein
MLERRVKARHISEIDKFKYLIWGKTHNHRSIRLYALYEVKINEETICR